MGVILNRRRFFAGALSLLAAPAIVRVASLMPISAPKLMAHRSLDEIIATTLRARTGALAENYTRNTALLERLLENRLAGAEATFLAEWRPRIRAMYETGTGDDRSGLALLVA